MSGQERPDRLRVLVVEDECFVADDIARAPIRHGAEAVGPVPTVREARALAVWQFLDLAVLDINLRGELVYPLVAELTRRGAAIVFATGHDAAAVPADHEATPAWSRPFDVNGLAGVLPSLRRA